MKSDGPLCRKRWFLPLLAACWVLLSGWNLAFAQDRPRDPIQFEVDQAGWAMRAGAPVLLTVKIVCSSPGIMEGDLEIQVKDNVGEQIAQIQIPDLVYSPGRQEVDYLLPIQSHPLQTVLSITFIFREKNGGYFSNSAQLILPTRRSFVVPIVRGASEESSDDFAWLMLESWCPKHSTNAAFAPMLTITPRIRGADLPNDALKHLPHDIVVVEAEGFTELSGPKMHALEAWVQGGGSLFLQIGEQDLSTEQQAFLNRLIAKNPAVLDDVVEGTTLIPVIAGGAGVPLEYGFGQVWLTTERSWAGATEPDRHAALGFLWRLRQEHRDSLRQSGKLSLNPAKLEQQSQWNQYNRGYQGGPVSPGGQAGVDFEQDQILDWWAQILQVPRSSRPGEMIEALMPRDVRAVPVWLLSSMILVYIAAIGFGDYIVLGQLKRRRWTWFTFPAMTLLVSLLSIGTAKGYLGTSQELSAVEFRDVAEDGTICRVSRFELLFRSSSGRADTKLDNAAFTPVARQAPSQQYPQYPQNSAQSLETQLVLIEGIPTAQATVTQQIEQWKPQLNRTVTFPRGQKAPLTLPTPGPGLRHSSPEFATQLEATIRAALPKSTGQLFFGPQGLIARQSGLEGTLSNPESTRQHQLMMSCQPPSRQSNQGSTGLFTLFDQISPSADTGLADMVMATPGHEVLCVAVREANNELVIYRWRYLVP